MGRDTLQCSQRWVRLPHSVWRWDNTGHRSIDASCQKYHNTMIHHFGGSGDSELNDPKGVAVGHNVIAVSDWDVVKKFSLHGDYLSKFGTFGSGDSQFHLPIGLCLLKSINIFYDQGDDIILYYCKTRLFIFTKNMHYTKHFIG